MKPIATLRQRGDGSFELLTTRYTKTLVDDIRRLVPFKTRSWNGTRKVWTFADSAASGVKALAETWKLDVPEGLEVVDATDVKELVNVYLSDDDTKVVLDFPYTADLNENCRANVPSVAFHPSTKTYRTPVINVEAAVKWAKYHGLTVSTEVERKAREERTRIDAMNEASYGVTSDFQTVATAIDLLPYQRKGVELLLTRRRAILGDEPGLGKTAQALTAAVQANAFPIVVVSPNSMKPTWAKVEVPKFFPHLTVNIVNGLAPGRLERADVTVVNYDILAARADDLIALNPRALIVDESHYIRNGQAKYHCPTCNARVRSNSKQCMACNAKFQAAREHWTVRRTEGVMQLARAIPEDGVVFLLTGTPVHNRPTDLVPQLTAVGRIKDFGGPHRFKSRYYRTGTATHMMELNERLRATCYIRREKQTIYEELPELRTAVVLMDVEGTAFQEYKKIEADVVGHLAERARELAEEAGETGTRAYWEKRLRAEAAEHLVRISVLKNAAAELKFDAMREWITDFLADGEKLIAFGEHVELIESLYGHYTADSVVKIRGGVKQTDRLDAVERFQNTEACRLFLGNLAAASEGLTLTAASNVAFMELPWNWETVKQAAARCYGRVNDLHGAVAHFLLAEGTIDIDIYKLITNKKKISEAITSGVDPEANQSILADLLVALAKRGMGEGTA